MAAPFTGCTMTKSTKKAALADLAPSQDELTPYDKEHFTLYIELMDAIDCGALIDELCTDVLHIDPNADRDRAVKCLESHIVRARWFTTMDGLKHLVSNPRA